MGPSKSALTPSSVPPSSIVPLSNSALRLSSALPSNSAPLRLKQSLRQLLLRNVKTLFTKSALRPRFMSRPTLMLLDMLLPLPLLSMLFPLELLLLAFSLLLLESMELLSLLVLFLLDLNFLPTILASVKLMLKLMPMQMLSSLDSTPFQLPPLPLAQHQLLSLLPLLLLLLLLPQLLLLLNVSNRLKESAGRSQSSPPAPLQFPDVSLSPSASKFPTAWLFPSVSLSPTVLLSPSVSLFLSVSLSPGHTARPSPGRFPTLSATPSL